MRMIQIQDNISEQKNLKDKLESEQEKLHVEYNKVSSRIHPRPVHCSNVWKQIAHLKIEMDIDCVITIIKVDNNYYTHN